MQLTSKEAVQRFASLFLGRSDVWGALHGEAIKEQVPEAYYFGHLSGKTSLGIYPLRLDGNIRWCAVDIDKNEIDIAIAVVEVLASFGINKGVYLERSKGKGFHVLLLFSDWTPATSVRWILKSALLPAGLPQTTEIFPKQDQLTKDTPWGNYLNLPYFGGDNPDGKRMILHPDTHQPIPLLIWLENVDTFPIEELSSVCSRLTPNSQDNSTLPSLKTGLRELLSTAHTTGSRRPTLASVIGHLRSRGLAEDVAVLLVVPWARDHFSPSLPDTEVEMHIRGIYRRYGIASGSHNRSKGRVILPTIEVS